MGISAMLMRILATASILFTTFGATATPMTCERFRNALVEAIEAGGSHVATPRLDAVAFRHDDGSLVRYDMKGIAALDGSLRCAASDKIEGFDVGVEVTSDEGAIRIYRLTALAAAAVCSVAPTMTPAACKALVDRLSRKATKGFASAYVRGEEMPSDFAKEKLPNGYEIEFDAAPGDLSFIVSPSVE
jgi:hypothetical protein